MRLSIGFPDITAGRMATLFGVVGLVLLAVSVRSAVQRVTALRSWNRVQAEVVAGTVASYSRGDQREAMYAPRLHLRYDHGGRQFEVPATGEVYSSHFASQVRTVREATRAGHVDVLLDPTNLASPVLNAGYNLEYFFGSLVPGFIGAVFVCLATLLWRAFRDDAPGATAPRRPTSDRWIVAFFLVLGMAFIGGGSSALYAAHRQMTGWVPVNARIDSSDIVRKSGRSGGTGGGATSGSTPTELFAARAWLSYRVRDSVFHAPVVRGAYSNDRDAAEVGAASLQQAGMFEARVDPDDPFDVTADRRNAWVTYGFPALFIIPGLICTGLAVALGRGKKRKKRTSRVRRPRSKDRTPRHGEPTLGGIDADPTNQHASAPRSSARAGRDRHRARQRIRTGAGPASQGDDSNARR